MEQIKIATILKPISQIIGWLYLGQNENHPQYQEKISHLLKSYIEKINNRSIVFSESLSDIGLMLMLTLKKQILPEQYKIYLNNIDSLLLDSLYKKHLQILNFENGIWKIILYFRELLLSPQKYRYYNIIYYKECLIYILDETYCLLNKNDYPEKDATMIALSSKNKKDCALSLWVCYSLNNININQITLNKIEKKISDYIQSYFTQTTDRKTVDIWLLYIWYKVKHENPRDELYFYRWFAEWKQNTKLESLTIPENYLYQECCRICDESSLFKNCSGDIESAFDIFMLQEILNFHKE